MLCSVLVVALHLAAHKRPQSVCKPSAVLFVCIIVVFILFAHLSKRHYLGEWIGMHQCVRFPAPAPQLLLVATVRLLLGDYKQCSSICLLHTKVLFIHAS